MRVYAHACACTHIRLRNKELLELLPRVFGLPEGPEVHFKPERKENLTLERQSVQLVTPRFSSGES